MSTVIQNQSISFGLGLLNAVKLSAFSRDDTFLKIYS